MNNFTSTFLLVYSLTCKDYTTCYGNIMKNHNSSDIVHLVTLLFKKKQPTVFIEN
ncbi:MAG: hypothetical protein ACI9N3_002362 [Colwellia sp.]|jgi:hypothetical protein